MKKTLLLLASMVACATSVFAQWTQPVPNFVPMADDGETEQYLYNVEAGGFFTADYIGGDKHWQTRATVNDTIGNKVKIAKAYEDESQTVNLGTWILWNYVPKFKEYRKAFAGKYDDIWTDNNNGANCDGWVFSAIDGGQYEITNPGAGTGKLGTVTLDGETDSHMLFHLYLVDSDEFDFTNPCTTWAFVTPEEYDLIIPRMKTYAAAMKLKAILESEDAAIVKDKSAYEAVYNNTNSTVEELQAAAQALNQAIIDEKGNIATPENPIDMTSVVPSNTFDDGYTGWTSTTGCQNNGLATNRTNDADYPGTPMTGKFWENWSPNAFSGKMYTKLEGMPKGVYSLQLDAFANGSDGENNAWVYANNDSVRTGGTNTLGEEDIELSDKVATFTVYGTVAEDGKLEIGLTQSTNSANWIGIDNAKLTYYGSSFDAYKMWFNHLRQIVINDMNKLIDEDTKYNKAQKAAFEEALKNGENASTIEELLAAAKVLTDAAQETIASIEAYKNYQEKVKEILDYLGENTDIMGDKIMELSDYVNEDEAIEPNDEWKNGSAKYILDNCLLSTKEIEAETKWLDEFFKSAIKTGMAEGSDVSFMLTNPKFDQQFEGWTYKDGKMGDNNVECYEQVVDCYQVVTDVPNGLYKLTCQAFERPAANGTWTGEEEPSVFIFMNNFQSPVQNIGKGGITYDEAVNKVNCLLNDEGKADNVWPNDYEHPEYGIVPNSITGARYAFEGGRYVQTVYGLVTDGTMKIGITSNGKQIHWVIWANFTLTYMGKNEEALQSVLSDLSEVLGDYVEENSDEMSEPAVAAATNALAEGDAASTSDEMWDAVVAINEQITATKENVAAVEAFSAAKDAMNEAAENYPEASDEALAAYSENSDAEYTDMTTEEIKAQTAKFLEIAAKLRIPNNAATASDNAPVDFTQVLVNPGFDENTDGWSGDKAAYDSNATNAEFYSKNFNMYQELYGLPAGTYELKVQGFYRQGSATNDYKAYTGEVEDATNAKLYANNDSIGLVHPSSNVVESKEDITDYAKCGEGTDGNLYIPNRMWVAGFEDGNYWNSLIFNYDGNGVLKVGLAKSVLIETDWTLFDNFQLIYYGANSTKEPNGGSNAIEETSAVVAAPAAIYNAAGIKVKSMTKGLNIIKMSDGSVRKVIVK